MWVNWPPGASTNGFLLVSRYLMPSNNNHQWSQFTGRSGAERKKPSGMQTKQTAGRHSLPLNRPRGFVIQKGLVCFPCVKEFCQPCFKSLRMCGMGNLSSTRSALFIIPLQTSVKPCIKRLSMNRRMDVLESLQNDKWCSTWASINGSLYTVISH